MSFFDKNLLDCRWVKRGLACAMASWLMGALPLAGWLGQPTADAFAAAKDKKQAKATPVKKTVKPVRKNVTQKEAQPVRKGPPRLVKQTEERTYATSSFGQIAGLHRSDDPLSLKSAVAFVEDLDSKQVLFSKNPDAVLPIASITKLMTALVVLDGRLPMDEVLTVTEEDVDTEKHSRSRIPVGTSLTRADMLHLALMASENRAAHALGRHYPGGLRAFVQAMNVKAQLLGMRDTKFIEPTGLSSQNMSSAPDLAKLVAAAYRVDAIREFSTDDEHTFMVGSRMVRFNNTNALVRSNDWDIAVSKTGFIAEAGRCLVMQTRIQGRHLAIVLLDSIGKQSRLGDANRLKKWLELNGVQLANATPTSTTPLPR